MNQLYELEISAKEENLRLVSMHMTYASHSLSPKFKNHFTTKLINNEPIVVCTFDGKEVHILKCGEKENEFIILSDRYKDERSFNLIKDCITYYIFKNSLKY